MQLIVGDVHGCLEELDDLLSLVSFRPGVDVLYSVGDLVDRGPDSIGVIRRMKELDAVVVRGNHDDKFLRWLNGRDVQINSGLETTVAECAKLSSAKLDNLRCYLKATPTIYRAEKFWVVHAEWDTGSNKKATNNNLRGSRKDFNGMSYRFNWWDFYNGYAPVFYGHYWFSDVQYIRRGYQSTIGLDTSCVRGGKLSGYIWEEAAIVSVPAKAVYCTHNDSSRKASEEAAWRFWKEHLNVSSS